MKTIILLGLSFILSAVITNPTHTKSGADIDYYLLRDVICKYETQGIKYPDNAVSKTRFRSTDRKIVGGAWGRCQIMLESAYTVGYSKRRSPGDLFKRIVNKEFALKILHHCERRLIARNINPTVMGLTHCYGTGFIARNPRSNYAKQVTLLYADAFIELRFGAMNWLKGTLGL